MSNRERSQATKAALKELFENLIPDANQPHMELPQLCLACKVLKIDVPQKTIENVAHKYPFGKLNSDQFCKEMNDLLYRKDRSKAMKDEFDSVSGGKEYITKEDFDEVFSAGRCMSNHINADEVFKTLDSNDDGKLSFEDYKKFVS